MTSWVGHHDTCYYTVIPAEEPGSIFRRIPLHMYIDSASPAFVGAGRGNNDRVAHETPVLP